MIILGITGSIGMGKSTLAAMLSTLGIATHDSDAAVHHLLSNDEQTRLALAAQFPYYKYFSIYGRKNKNGIRGFDRKKLSKLVFENPKERLKLEKILHPLVQKSQTDFIRIQRNMGAEFIVLDIPLLFETGAEERVDYTIVASAPAFIQQTRVLGRPNMSEKKFKQIMATQMGNDEKCVRADFIVPTGLGRRETMKALKQILYDLRHKNQKVSKFP